MSVTLVARDRDGKVLKQQTFSPLLRDDLAWRQVLLGFQDGAERVEIIREG